MATGEQDMQFDSEGDQNSVDSFEKQLQQQEMELRQEQEAQKEAVEEKETNDASWMEQSSESIEAEITNGNSKHQEMEEEDEEESSGGVKRSSPEPPTEEASKEESSDEPPTKKGKQDELSKLWSTINENKEDFQAWTNMLQYVDQQSELEAGREAYTSFFARYPYCYGYWKKYADLEKRKGSEDSTLKVFETGLSAIPLSVDLWVHYLDYVSNTFLKEEEEVFVRTQFDRAVQSCGLEYKSDKMWDAFICWEGNNKRWHRVTAVYDKLLATPTAKYSQHWTKFQEHIKKHPVTEVISLTEFLTHRRSLNKKKEEETEEGEEEAPPGVEDDSVEKGGSGAVETPASSKLEVTEEECKSIQQEILSTREKLSTDTTEQVKLRLPYEDAIKRPYFHVKPLEKSQLQAWRDYLTFEADTGTEMRLRTLFERCLIATALYEEFWLRYIEYLDTLPSVTPKEMRDVFERSCNVHLKNKIKPHLAWALFEEEQGDTEASLQLLRCLQERLPDALEPWVQRAALERRRGELEDAEQVFGEALQHFRTRNDDLLTLPHAVLLVKYSRFVGFCMRDHERAIKILDSVVSEKTEGSVELPVDEQKAVEALLWALFERHLSLSSPDMKAALQILTTGSSELLSPSSRLTFATRRHQLILEFGSGDQTVRESAKNLRTLEESLRGLISEKSKGEEQTDDTPRNKKNSKGTDKQGGQQNGGGSGGSYGGSSPYQQFPPSGGTPQQPPPQHPPPSQGGNYGGYNNQNYPPQQGGSYPPQQQYQGWGYPPQGGNYGYGNQQQWSGYNNYYGGQR